MPNSPAILHRTTESVPRFEDDQIESLRAQFDIETFDALIGGLIDDVRWRLDRLGSADALDHLDRVFRDAHDIKSVAGGFGLHHLADLARTTEHASRAEDREATRTALSRLITTGRTQITTIAVRYRNH